MYVISPHRSTQDKCMLSHKGTPLFFSAVYGLTPTSVKLTITLESVLSISNVICKSCRSCPFILLLCKVGNILNVYLYLNVTLSFVISQPRTQELKLEISQKWMTDVLSLKRKQAFRISRYSFVFILTFPQCIVLGIAWQTENCGYSVACHRRSCYTIFKVHLLELAAI